MARLLDIASTELGVREVEGTFHNDRILQYAKEAGFDWVDDDETPWCSIFLNWVCAKAGFERTHDARANSWKHIGRPTNSPRPGDLVLFSSNGEHVYHVGIFAGYNSLGNSVFCLGGNQSNEVNIATFPATLVHSFRRIAEDPSAFAEMAKDVVEDSLPAQPSKPSPATERRAPEPRPTNPHTPRPRTNSRTIEVPSQKLRFGDTGADVEKLQAVLNAIGYPTVSPPNGLFSAATARAIRELQLAHGLKSHGKYNRKTKKLLEEKVKGL